MIDPYLQERTETLVTALEDALDTLPKLRAAAATKAADAKKAYATAILDASTHGAKNREERVARADLASADLDAAAEIYERQYRDQLTYIRALQTQLDLVRTTIVTARQIQV